MICVYKYLLYFVGLSRPKDISIDILEQHFSSPKATLTTFTEKLDKLF